jgi:N-acetylmuramoyl-L-alanine amidase CwlA
MKKMKIVCVFMLGLTIFLTACNTATPEKYFDTAVLNTNQFNDFASERFTKSLVDYTVKHEGVQQQDMSATKVVETKVLVIEKALSNVKALKQTDETKEMLQTSIVMHEYVLPVYKKEYMALAKLCDSGAPKDEIAAMGLEIDNKYAAGFDALFEKLTAEGKAYATKNNIDVTWGN